MFKTETCVTIACDHCGNRLEYDERIPHFDTEADALEAAREYEWTRTRDGKVYCEGYELPACTCPDEEACGEACPIGCPCVLHDEVKAPDQAELFPEPATA